MPTKVKSQEAKGQEDKHSEAWAIKIGGSLYASQHLMTWLEVISQYTAKKIIIIPGGGPFANQVRDADQKFGLDQREAHLMAVMAMQQYGGVLKSLCPTLVAANSIDKIHRAWDKVNTVIWEPYEMVRDQCRLASSWDISSDSLAVWIAGRLKINNLLLVKSSRLVLDSSSFKTLVENNCIDPDIQELAKNNQVKIHFSHESKANELSSILN